VVTSGPRGAFSNVLRRVGMRTHRIVGGLVLVTFVAACGLTSEQRAVATQLGHAAQSSGDFASDQFPKLRQMVISMNETDVEIGGTRKPGELDKNFSASTVAIRVQAARALASYGELLIALVTETQAAELQQASNDFVSSVKSISGKRLSDAQLDAIGSIVDQARGWIVEYKRAKAIKAIVPQAAPEVEHLCDLLIKDFSQTGMNLSQQVDATAQRLRGDIDVALAEKDTSFAERSAAMQGQILAEQADAELTLVNAQAIQALRALKTANRDLVKALTEQQYNAADIENLGAQINMLASAIKTVSGR